MSCFVGKTNKYERRPADFCYVSQYVLIVFTTEIFDLKGKFTVEEVTTMFEKTTFGEYTPVFEKLMADMRDNKPNFRGNFVRSRGGTPSLRSNPTRGDGNMAGNRGYDPKVRGIVTRWDGSITNNRGHSPKRKGNFARGDGNLATSRVTTQTSDATL